MYTLTAIVVVRMPSIRVRRVRSGYLLNLLLFAAPVLLHQQVMRLKPIVVVSTVISTWPCCFCCGSGWVEVMLFLLVTYRYAQFVFLTQ